MVVDDQVNFVLAETVAGTQDKEVSILTLPVAACTNNLKSVSASKIQSCYYVSGNELLVYMWCLYMYIRSVIDHTVS